MTGDAAAGRVSAILGSVVRVALARDVALGEVMHVGDERLHGEVIERDDMRHLRGDAGREGECRGIERVAIAVREAHQELDPLVGFDARVVPGIEDLAEIGRLHARQRGPALAEVHPAHRRGEPLGAPPLLDLLRIGPGIPDDVDGRLEDALDGEAELGWFRRLGHGH